MVRTLWLGALFGFLLARSGATDPDRIAGMFLFQDPHLAVVMGVAVGVIGVGFAWVRRGPRRGADGAVLRLVAKPRHRGNLWGGLIFGAGWALTGACPGTALAQVGQGRLAGMFTVAGILGGAALFRGWRAAGRKRDAPRADEAAG